jgi:hypothetical protein
MQLRIKLLIGKSAPSAAVCGGQAFVSCLTRSDEKWLNRPVSTITRNVFIPSHINTESLVH